MFWWIPAWFPWVAEGCLSWSLVWYTGSMLCLRTGSIAAPRLNLNTGICCHFKEEGFHSQTIILWSEKMTDNYKLDVRSKTHTTGEPDACMRLQTESPWRLEMVVLDHSTKNPRVCICNPVPLSTTCAWAKTTVKAFYIHGKFRKYFIKAKFRTCCVISNRMKIYSWKKIQSNK